MLFEPKVLSIKFLLFSSIVLSYFNIHAKSAESFITDREKDSLALVNFYHATQANGPWLEEWDLNKPMNTWYGVSLNYDGRVSGIFILNNNNLSGVFPRTFGNLRELISIAIWHNDLKGSIPTTFEKLINLRIITLFDNKISSIGASLSKLPELQTLSLSLNRLRGEIPKDLTKISKLKTLHIQHNLLSGSIPVEIKNLKELTTLMLQDNALSGEIPEEIGELKKLKTLRFDNNNLQGCLPASIGLLTELHTLIGVKNNLNGNFPLSYNNLCDIRVDLKLNPSLVFNGVLSKFCEGQPQLSTSCMDVSEPEEQEPMANGDSMNDSLALVALYNNTNGDNWTRPWDLQQPISTWRGVTINSENRVTLISLRNNNLTGVIPSQIKYLTELKTIIFTQNNLMGNLPLEISSLQNLERLLVSNNNLSGQLPPSFSQLKNLTHFFANHNNLEGNYPKEYSIFCLQETIILTYRNKLLEYQGDYSNFCTNP